MLIGIDMLAVQSPRTGDRESGRYGRQLVASLLASDPVHRYILYTHEGFPTHRIPSVRNALRVSLAPIPGGSMRLRPTIQRVIDQNPDGLDWLILLDPFEPNYVGMPPESPLNELKIASLVLDLAPSQIDDRRLSPLRRHDAILAVSDATALECRKRLGSASWRVARLDVASDSSFAGESLIDPLTRVSGEELGRLGINGPFLFSYLVGGAERANLSGIIDAYSRLPIEQRRRLQLVIAGVVAEPWKVVAFLHARGCAEGLVLAGEVDEATLRMLFRRCSAFLSPSIEEGCGLTIVEAMLCGSAVVVGSTGAQPEIVGDAGVVVEPTNPGDIAEQLAGLLDDADLEHQIRRRAIDRAARFGWEPVVGSVLSALQSEQSSEAGRRHRIDSAHVARPRIAIYPEIDETGANLVEIVDQIPWAWLNTYNIDLYFDPEHTAIVNGIPTEFGGFDTRQFDRNDGILGYHAVVYRLSRLEDLQSRLARLRIRPGLVLIGADASFDRLGLDPETTASSLIVSRLRELFLTSSRLGVRSRLQLDRITACLPEFAGQVIELPIDGTSDPEAASPVLLMEIDRCAAELRRGPGRQPKRPRVVSHSTGSTPHSIRPSSLDDEVAPGRGERR